MRQRWLQLIFTGMLLLGAASEGLGQPGCGGFGFARRSVVFGGGWRGGWGCQPCFGWRPACFGWRPACGGWPVNSCWGPGWGGSGYGLGWPGCGFGGLYGGSRSYGFESVFLSLPYGGGASFFSGSVVPYPVPVWVPYAAPYAVPVPLWFGAVRGRGPLASAEALAPARPVEMTRGLAAIARSPGAVRSSSPGARKRATKLVAVGDGELLASAGGTAGLKAAEVSYRRATAAVTDDPELHIRHALALAWLGRNAEAAAACSRAVAIDGRLSDRPADRQPGQLPPIVFRGQRILADLAAHLDAEDVAARASVAAFEARWIRGEAAPIEALAARGPSGR